MQKFLDGLLKAVQTINAYLSDYVLVILLIGVGLFYTIKTKFVQIRCFGQGMKAFGRKTQKRYEFVSGVHHRRRGAGRHG